MQLLTQTQKHNCFQTCIAMLLGVPAESIPEQHVADNHVDYVNRARVFLDKHYGLTYVEGDVETFRQHVDGRSHVMIGDTNRSKEAWHAVIGMSGKLYWDVSPAKAGLTKVRAFGLLVPTPKEWRGVWKAEECTCTQCVNASIKTLAC